MTKRFSTNSEEWILTQVECPILDHAKARVYKQTNGTNNAIIKVHCVQRLQGGDYCPMRAFECTKKGISCTVCSKP